MSVIVPTAEQKGVIELSKIHNEIKIAAYAGAAKTSTLTMVAEEHIVPSLFLTFNKALAVDAQARFPSWVECRTTHSLAYQAFGAPLQNKLSRPKGAYKNVAGTGTEIAKYFKLGDFLYLLQGEREERKIKKGGVGVAIKETVARYEQSGDKDMEFKHVSTTVCDTALLHDEKAMRSFKYHILTYAQKLWALRINPKIDVLCTHDTYLKLYQLSKPDLSKYEILYLDEVQDTAGVVLDIFLNQIGRCKLIAVGDEYQNIYSWRGAQNAMLKLDWPEARLTKSFRFGQSVGDIADCVLARNGEKITDVKGWEKLSTFVYAPTDIPQEIMDGQYAMLFRTNGALIFEAVRLMEMGKTVNLEIDVSDFTKMLDSAIELYKGNQWKVKHENFLQFEDWQEFGIEAEVVKGEMLRIFKMVENGSVYQILGLLSKHENVENPDVVLTTAHKGKGREWDVVVLAEDFPSPWDNEGKWVGLTDAERNLLYVALTRAKKVLCYNVTVMEMIERCMNKNKYDYDDLLSEEQLEAQRNIEEILRREAQELNTIVIGMGK